MFTDRIIVLCRRHGSRGRSSRLCLNEDEVDKVTKFATVELVWFCFGFHESEETIFFLDRTRGRESLLFIAASVV